MTENLITRVQPSIIATDGLGLTAKLDSFADYFLRFHVDIMVPPSVKNHSLDFSGAAGILASHSSKARYGLHIMSCDALEFLFRNLSLNLERRTDSIVVHYEMGEGKLREFARYFGDRVERIGLAINPETKISDVSRFLKRYGVFNEILIMSVHPGQYGAEFLPYTMSKIDGIRDVFDGVVGLDGGVGPDTLWIIKGFKPDYVVVGSALQKADDKYVLARNIERCLEFA